MTLTVFDRPFLGASKSLSTPRPQLPITTETGSSWPGRRRPDQHYSPGLCELRTYVRPHGPTHLQWCHTGLSFWLKMGVQLLRGARSSQTCVLHVLIAGNRVLSYGVYICTWKGARVHLAPLPGVIKSLTPAPTKRRCNHTITTTHHRQ
jgi:hypothetical protein